MQFAQKLLATRGGTIAVSGLAALLAAVIFLAYLNQYRSSLNEAAQPTTVLVAKSLIEKGTSGDVIGSHELFQTTDMPKSELKEGAITDAATLRGRIAMHDVYPGQQLTAADFTATPTDSVRTKIAENERAIAIPLDAAHGLIGHIESGDRVDVLAGFNVERGDVTRPVLKAIMQDVLVLQAPAKTEAGIGAGGGQTGNVVLRMSDRQAADLAFASDNGKVWVVLRPKTGASDYRPSLVTLETVLFGVRPIRVADAYGAKP